jgi:MFS family permease
MAAAAGYGLAASLFTGTTWVPAAYTGAFLWGVAGSVFFAVAFTALQQAAPMDAHGRVMSINATLQSWTETIALPLGGLTLAALGVRGGALTLAGVALAAGLIGLAVVTVHPPRALTTPVIEGGERKE